MVTGIIEEYVFEKFLDRIFGEARYYYWIYWNGEKPPEVQKEERIEELQEREEELLAEMEQKDEKIEEVKDKLDVVRDDLTVRERLIESLEREGISRRELIRKFDERIPALIINYTSTNKDNWLKDVLNEKYDSVGLSGGERVIPPDNVPDALLTEEMTIDEWIEEELFEGKDDREAVIVHASLVDLRYTGWEKNTHAYGDTIEQRISVTDYLEDGFYKLDEITNSIEHIEKGDIGFLAGKYVTRKEMKEIHENQNEIEERLGNPDIKELGDEETKAELVEVLDEYVANPENVASGIIFQARICREVFFDENMDLDVEGITDIEEAKLQTQ